MKRILTIMAFMCIGFGVHAQGSKDWTLMHSINGVEIYSKEVVCNPVGNDIQAEMIILKAVNKTGNTKTISWQYEISYDGKCLTCNNEEYLITFQLDGYKSITGDCHLEEGKPTLSIHKRYVNNIPNYQEFTGFSLSKLTVN